MDTSFFKEIKPYSRKGNNIKNAKRIYHFIIEFMCKIMSSKMANAEHNELTHGIYSVRISPFINSFLYTSPGFFKPFSSIIINLGHPISVILINGVLSAGLHRRFINQRVIIIINEKR